MRIGIVGLPQCGKTTIFKLLTNVETKGNTKVNTGVAKVLDPRVTYLAKLFNPKKLSYAAIEMIDIAGFILSQTKKDGDFFDALRDVDAIVQVISTFTINNEMAAADDAQLDPIRDLDQVQAELVLADWNLVETRLEKLEKERMKNPQSNKEQVILTKCRELLEHDLPLRLLELTDEEAKDIRGYNFFTLKPLLLVVNVNETQMRQAKYPKQGQINTWAKERGIPIIIVSGQVEMEINELDEDDKIMFMKDMGIEETGIQRLSREVYAHLGLISYFTVGEDEVKAWTISQGTTAKQGAGKIHSDIERGFICAEVISYEDFVSLGSIQKVKEKGLFRLEGKDYIIADGDIISFRFNV